MTLKQHRTFAFRHFILVTPALALLGTGLFFPALSFSQIIGKSKSTVSAEENEGDKVSAMLSKLAEQLTTQQLNLKRVMCDETVTYQKFPAQGAGSTEVTENFKMIAQRKSSDPFDSDAALVETHTPLIEPSGKSASTEAIDDSVLVKDSFLSAADILGMEHREAYFQQFLRKDKIDSRSVYVIMFRTMKQLEDRTLQIAGKEVKMRLAGTFWIDVETGRLLVLQVKQTRLPKGVHEYSYEIKYPPATSPATAFTLPVSVRFTRNMDRETFITTQHFSNCTVN